MFFLPCFLQIDINVINVMTDEELGQYIVRYGDRLALKAFCRQRTVTTEKSGDVKSALMQRVRDRLREREQPKTPASGDTAGPGVGNRHAVKECRRVEMGWLHYAEGDYHQVRTRHGGGTRHLTVQKTVTMGELLDVLPKDHFKFDVRDFSHNTVPLESTVSQLYDQTKIRMLRIYTCSQEDKEVSPEDASIILSDASSDFEPTEDRPMKVISLLPHLCYKNI